MGVIYRLDFKSGKSYIGQTVRKLRVRIAVHRQSAAAQSMLPVHCAWRLHGEPEVHVIAESDDADELHALEIKAISDQGTRAPGGYNVSHGGETAPSKTPSVAAKIALKATGRVVKQEVREVIREKMKLRWQDPEYVARVRKGLLAAQSPELAKGTADRANKLWAKRKEDGWTMPESTRAKMREKVFSEETRVKMSESAKRRGPPTKALEASIIANKGRKHGEYSQDRVDKAAAGIKAAWQDPVKRERLMAARKAAWATRKAKAATLVSG